MIEFDILESSDVYGDNRLKSFVKYGTRCSLTDFAILTEGYVFQFNHTKEGTELKDRTCCWWTKTTYLGDVFAVDGNGYRTVEKVTTNCFALRPVTSFKKIATKMKNIRKNKFGIEIGEYGMYPNSVVDLKYSKKLEKLYKSNGLNATGKIYKTDDRKFVEYKHHGNRFIRIEQEKDYYAKKLNNGAEIKKGNIFWLNVEPIEWIIDRDSDKVFPLRGIVSNVKFDNMLHYYGDFKKSNIKKFLDEKFSKEIIPIKSDEQKITNDLTISDIFNYKYKNTKMLSKKEKENILLELINIDDFNIDSARDFAKQMGDDYLRIFDALREHETSDIVKHKDKLKIYTKLNK